MKKKVYCKNCKYDGFLDSQETSKLSRIKGWPFCNRENKPDKEKVFIKSKYINVKYKPRITSGKIKKIDRNKDGECVLYEKKWWKFWVK